MRVLAWNSATAYSTLRDILIPVALLISILGVRVRAWRVPAAKEFISSTIRTVVILLAFLVAAFVLVACRSEIVTTDAMRDV